MADLEISLFAIALEISRCNFEPRPFIEWPKTIFIEILCLFASVDFRKSFSRTIPSETWTATCHSMNRNTSVCKTVKAWIESNAFEALENKRLRLTWEHKHVSCRNRGKSRDQAERTFWYVMWTDAGSYWFAFPGRPSQLESWNVSGIDWRADFVASSWSFKHEAASGKSKSKSQFMLNRIVIRSKFRTQAAGSSILFSQFEVPNWRNSAILSDFSTWFCEGQASKTSILIKEISIQQLLINLSNNSGGSDPAPCPVGQAGPIRSQHAKRDCRLNNMDSEIRTGPFAGNCGRNSSKSLHFERLSSQQLGGAEGIFLHRPPRKSELNANGAILPRQVIIQASNNEWDSFMTRQKHSCQQMKEQYGHSDPAQIGNTPHGGIREASIATRIAKPPNGFSSLSAPGVGSRVNARISRHIAEQ